MDEIWKVFVGSPLMWCSLHLCDHGTPQICSLQALLKACSRARPRRKREDVWYYLGVEVSLVGGSLWCWWRIF